MNCLFIKRRNSQLFLCFFSYFYIFLDNGFRVCHIIIMINVRCTLNFFFFLLCYSLDLQSAVITKIVGSIGDSFLTSREVIAMRIIEDELFVDKKKTEPIDIESKSFTKIVNESLLEKVIALESFNFTLTQLAEQEVNENILRFNKNVLENKDWKGLQIESIELKELISNKLKVKKFLKYKTETATLGVTDEEVRFYYEKNRYKFGNMPLIQFKETIRLFLIKQQMEDRLKEWFEILKKKYKVKNLLPK